MDLDSSAREELADLLEDGNRAAISVRLLPIDPENEWEPEEDPLLASRCVARHAAQALLDAMVSYHVEFTKRTPNLNAARDLAACLPAWDKSDAALDIDQQLDSATALAEILQSIGEALDSDDTRRPDDDPLLTVAVSAITAVLAECISIAARRDDWDQAIELRGKYLRWWHHRCSADPTPAPSPRSRWREKHAHQIGEQIGGLHKKGVAHGTALLESFDSGARANNLTRLDFNSSEAGRLDDLVTFRYQVNQAEWASFRHGYRQSASDEAERHLNEAEQLAFDAERLDPLRNIALPAGRKPDFRVAALSYALRQFSEFAPQRRTLQTIAQYADASNEAVEATLSSLQQGFGLFENVTRLASSRLLSYVLDYYTNGKLDRAAEIAVRGLREVGHALSADEHIRLTLYLRLSRLGHDEDARASAMAQAAASLIPLAKPDVLQSAVRIAYLALRKAQKPATRGTCAITCIAALLQQSTPLGDPAPLRSILEVTALTLEVDVDQQQVLRVYTALAEHLVTLPPADRQGIYSIADCSGQSRLLVDELNEAIADAARRPDKVNPYEPPELIEIQLDAEDWRAAAVLLRRELENSRAPPLAKTERIGCAELLCFALQQMRDFEPHHHAALAQEVYQLVVCLAPILLDLNSDPPLASAMRRNVTNTVGLAAINAADDLTGEDATLLLSLGIELMELSTSLCDEKNAATAFSFSANNLALGYQRMALRQDKDGAQESLQRAAALLERVIEADRRLVSSPRALERRVSRTMDLDFLNLGLVCKDLAYRTYSRKWIRHKPLDSARSYRHAMLAFLDARDLAERARHAPIAATATNNLARLLVDICEAFVAERHWAGDTLHGAYYDWLCCLAGGRVGTVRLFQVCAVAALRSAWSAAREPHTNSMLMVECVDTMLAIFSLIQRKAALGADLRRDALVSILEVLETLPNRLNEEISHNQLGDLSALIGLFESLLRVELFGSGCAAVSQLRAAHDSFLKTSRYGHLVERAIARPYSHWLDVTAEDDGLQVNGLYIGSSSSGLEFRIPSQRRSMELTGLTLSHIECRLRSVSWLEKVCGLTTAHMEPQLTLEDVPFCIATTSIRAFGGSNPVTLTACKLPVPSWDSWALSLEGTGGDPLSFSVSYPFLGLYDIEKKTLEHNSPCSLKSASQVLLFGRPGVVLELAFPLATRSGSPGTVTVRGHRDRSEITLYGQSLSLVLRTAPQIAMGDVAYFVKQTNNADDAALCCSGALPSVSPSLSLPSSILHSFSPLFFFEEQLSAASVETINRFDLHEIVILGFPDNRKSADAMMEALFDPRRELLMLVSPSEQASATCAIERLQRTVGKSLVGRRLLRSSASAASYFEDFSNIQLIVVERSLAPAASQMLLDLAAARRASVDGKPLVSEGRIFRLSTKGNHAGWRRRTTLFPLGTSWDKLAESYIEKSKKRPVNVVLVDPSVNPALLDSMTGRIAKRPVVLFAPGEANCPALTPFIRHVGAIPVPATAAGMQFLEHLAPDILYAPVALHPMIPRGLWRLEPLPAGSLELALHFQAIVHRDHGTLLDTLAETHPTLISSRSLLEEARPAEYAVVSLTLANSRPWSYLAANYAAALGSPLLLIPQSIRSDVVQTLPSVLLQGSALHPPNDREPKRHFAAIEASLQRNSTAIAVAGDRAIAALNPTYVGVVCERPDVAIELVGEPPLATRIAVGRLAGPDLVSTSILITAAALSENTQRASILQGVVMEAANAMPGHPLPGAKLEAETISRSLEAIKAVQVTLKRDVDRKTFLLELTNAHIVHFAGHGAFRDRDPEHSGLIVFDGIIAERDLEVCLAGAPLVFSNACQSGILSNHPDASRSWSGLAAAFINAGAVNYLGTLWPVSDEVSRRLAESFYRDLFDKKPTGEALRLARKAAFDDRNSTWAAYVLFGCPRTRFYAEG